MDVDPMRLWGYSVDGESQDAAAPDEDFVFHRYVAGEDYTTEQPFDKEPSRDLDLDPVQDGAAQSNDDSFSFVRWSASDDKVIEDTGATEGRDDDDSFSFVRWSASDDKAIEDTGATEVGVDDAMIVCDICVWDIFA